jgi:hypothetical protein
MGSIGKVNEKTKKAVGEVRWSEDQGKTKKVDGVKIRAGVTPGGRGYVSMRKPNKAKRTIIATGVKVSNQSTVSHDGKEGNWDTRGRLKSTSPKGRVKKTGLRDPHQLTGDSGDYLKIGKPNHNKIKSKPKTDVKNPDYAKAFATSGLTHAPQKAKPKKK